VTLDCFQVLLESAEPQAPLRGMSGCSISHIPQQCRRISVSISSKMDPLQISM